MATSKEISNLVINKVESQVVYDYMVDNNLVNDDELYLIENDGSELEVVMYTAQELTDEQKAQARANIDAIDSVQVNDELNEAISPINYTRIELPSAQTWCTRGPFYANGRFIIPSRSGVIAYSDDGINWSDATIDPGFVMIEACYGNGMYIATDDFDHRIYYSTDGISWSKTADIGFYPAAIGYGNGVFVALDHESTTAAYSTDGIHWTETTIPYIASWDSIAYGNGKFVAVANRDEDKSWSTRIIYSEDGITWKQNGIATGYYGSIAYGNDKFVIKSTSSHEDFNFFLCSENGINWTKVTLDYDGSKDGSIKFCGDRFINISSDNSLKYSYDGVSWTIVQIPNDISNKYAYGDGKFIGTMTAGIGSSGNEAYCFTLGNKFGIVFKHELKECQEDLMSYANNRMSLEQVGTILPIDGVDEVAFGDGKYVAVRQDSVDNVAYSLDGITWDKINIDPGHWDNITYGNSRFLISSTTGHYAHSSDGINWTTYQLDGGETFSDVTYGNGKFIAVSYLSIYSSTDGSTWTEVHNNNNWPCYIAVTYGNGKFVAVTDYTGIVSTSTDGVTWTDSESLAVDSYYCTTYGNSKFVILPYSSSNTTGYYSTDASTWSTMTVPAGWWSTIKYGNGVFVATGSSSNVIYSSDGINWTSITLPQAVATLEYAEGRFIALGNSNRYVFTSVNGSEWTMLTKDDVLQNNESITARVSESIYQTSVAMHKESYLPSATSDNDGQFLRVVNGIPTWTTIPSAEEASF